MKVVANGLGVHYRLEGPPAGPVVTLSHSLGANLDLWDDQVAALSSRYRVLRYDARGHGHTDVPAGSYTLDQMADDLRGLLQPLGVGATHFVGLSMGGCIGMTAAVKYPGLLRSLVLADTTSRYALQTAAMWAARIKTAETAGMEPVIEPTMDIWFTPDFRLREKTRVDRVRQMLRTTDPRGYVGAIRAIADVDLTERLGEIRCPTLVLVGEHDPGTTPAMARVLAERIPGARLTILPAARHCSCVEAAAAFNDAVLGFLAEVA